MNQAVASRKCSQRLPPHILDFRHGMSQVIVTCPCLGLGRCHLGNLGDVLHFGLAFRHLYFNHRSTNASHCRTLGADTLLKTLIPQGLIPHLNPHQW